jgi:predicted RNase H-like nuclease (RuvC/YqgF family)
VKKEKEFLLKQFLEESSKRNAEKPEQSMSQRIKQKTKQLSECNSTIQKLQKENKDLLERFQTVNRRTNQYLLKQVYKTYIIYYY